MVARLKLRRSSEKNVPDICGGIHLSLYKDIKKHPFTSILIGEGEDVWHIMLDDCKKSVLKLLYMNNKHSTLVEINSEKVSRYIDY